MNRGLKILVEQALVPFDAALNSCTINRPDVWAWITEREGLQPDATGIWWYWMMITACSRLGAEDAQCFDESIRTVLFKGIFVTVRHSMTFH